MCWKKDDLTRIHDVETRYLVLRRLTTLKVMLIEWLVLRKVRTCVYRGGEGSYRTGREEC